MKDYFKLYFRRDVSCEQVRRLADYFIQHPGFLRWDSPLPKMVNGELPGNPLAVEVRTPAAEHFAGGLCDFRMINRVEWLNQAEGSWLVIRSCNL